MSFPFNYFLTAFAGAFLTTLLALPLWRKWCLRIQLVDDPGRRKIHDQPVPLAGGLAVLTGILLPLAAGAILLKTGAHVLNQTQPIAHGLQVRGLELATIAFGAIAITLLGWLDDRHELKPLPKFVGQLLVAVAVAMACKRITLFVHNDVFSYAITIFWILAVINAFNFMDNMNGLCAGLGAIGALLFAIIAAANGEYLVATIGFLMCGALIGFLPWNFPNARAFLGDAGSHLVGYLLAVMAILPHFYTKQNPHRLAVLSPLLVLAIPLIDLAQVVISRTLNRKPFWIGDTNHLSHRLVRAGMSRTRAVLLLWLVAVMIGIVSPVAVAGLFLTAIFSFVSFVSFVVKIFRVKLLFIGDIVGQPGRNAVKTLLPKLCEQHALDFVIANGENSAGGSGITPNIAVEIFAAGVDVITSGDHLWDQKEVMELLANEKRFLRPLNYPAGTPGQGSGVFEIRSEGRVTQSQIRSRGLV